MDKITEFLVQLEEELKYLKPKDLEQVLKFYRDKINIQQDYGESVDKIIASLPSPSYIAKEVYESKGKEYLNDRKKQIRKNQIIKSICNVDPKLPWKLNDALKQGKYKPSIWIDFTGKTVDMLWEDYAKANS